MAKAKVALMKIKRLGHKLEKVIEPRMTKFIIVAAEILFVFHIHYFVLSQPPSKKMNT